VHEYFEPEFANRQQLVVEACNRGGCWLINR